jgi:hypothetical protein
MPPIAGSRTEAAGAGVPRGNIGTLEKIRDAIEAAGVEFLGTSQRSNGGGPGIRLRRDLARAATFITLAH